MPRPPFPLLPEPKGRIVIPRPGEPMIIPGPRNDTLIMPDGSLQTRPSLGGNLLIEEARRQAAEEAMRRQQEEAERRLPIYPDGDFPDPPYHSGTT